jgi:hypothetical protein
MSKPNGVILEPYTDVSFVLRGDTKPYKEDIKRLGGKWGPKLKDGPAWLFPKSKQDIVGKWLDTGIIDEGNIQYRNKSLEEQVKDLSLQVYKLQKNVGRVLEILTNTNAREEEDEEKPVRLLGSKK